MPSIRPKGPETEPRSTFRPPWVKDGPPPLPAPPPSWIGNRRPSEQEATTPKPEGIVRPKLKEIRKDSIHDNKGVEAKTIPIRIEGDNSKESKASQPGKSKGTNSAEVPAVKRDKKLTEVGDNRIRKAGEKKVTVQIPEKPPKIPKEEVTPNRNDANLKNTKIKNESNNMAAAPPPPPLPPPKPPAVPGFQRKPISEEKKQKLDALRNRPRRRPDWTDMMKEVETGIKLKHVACNDRSAPIIPKAKAKGQFVYESEKQNAHNQLLKEIQSGVTLKKVKTNDRSKPILNGLRKFRRQMTIEEQIQKSASVADVIAVAAEPDELDDIDKVRDDLQSTKQMLALEMRNKEALERENKRLMARLLNMEVELEKEKTTRRLQEEGRQIVPVRTTEDEQLITKLKEEASQSAKMAKDMEDQYHKTAEELDLTRAKLESSWLRNSQLEMELKSKGKIDINQRPIKRPSMVDVGSNESEASDSDTEEGSQEEDLNEQTPMSKDERQYNLLSLKVANFKEKRSNAAREKKNLKNQLNKIQTLFKEEKRRYRMLQSEVEKMAIIMRDDEDGESGAEEPEDEEPEDDEEEEEKESDSSSTDAESEGEPDNETPIEEKIKFLERKIKNYETILNRAKKANYLLKANIDRRQDDLNRQRELSLGLQEDLNAVLSELG